MWLWGVEGLMQVWRNKTHLGPRPKLSPSVKLESTPSTKRKESYIEVEMTLIITVNQIITTGKCEQNYHRQKTFKQKQFRAARRITFLTSLCFIVHQCVSPTSSLWSWVLAFASNVSVFPELNIAILDFARVNPCGSWTVF